MSAWSKWVQCLRSFKNLVCILELSPADEMGHQGAIAVGAVWVLLQKLIENQRSLFELTAVSVAFGKLT